MTKLIVGRVCLLALVSLLGFSNSISAQRKLPAVLQAPRSAAGVNQKTDALGFVWDIDSRGGIRYGSSVFRSACLLYINGSSFTPTQTTTSSNRTEYIFRGSRSGLTITRQVKVDSKSSTVRYVEMFMNPGRQPITVTAMLGTTMRAPCKPAITDNGTPAGELLGAKDAGVLALSATSSTTRVPAVLFYLADANSSVKPTLQVRQPVTFAFNYLITVPPGKTLSLVHGMAQRRLTGTPNAKTVAELFKPFKSPAWLEDLPASFRPTIINQGTALDAAAVADEGPLVVGVLALAARWGITRGEADVLAVDDQTRLSGKVTGDDVSVATRFGKVTLPLKEIAAIVGGGGTARPMRVYLRNGEILSGEVEADVLSMQDNNGLEIRLRPDELNVLVLHTGKGDGKPSAKTAALLQTLNGDLLALGEKTEGKLDVLTPWGPVEIPLRDVRHLLATSNPNPLYSIGVSNGSRLSAIVQTEELTLPTLRFGPKKVEVAGIVQLVRLGTVDTSTTVPAVIAPTGTKSALKIRADQLLAEARVHLQKGDYDQARIKALAAHQLNVSYGPFDAQPQHVLVEIQRRQGGRTSPSQPTAPTRFPSSGTTSRAFSGRSPVSRSSTSRSPTMPAFFGAKNSSSNPLASLIPRIAPAADASYAGLAGDNILVGTLAMKTIQVQTSAGQTILQTSRIRSMQPSGEEALNPVFEIDLAGENEGETKKVIGQLRGGVFPLIAFGRKWNIPARHLAAFHQPAPPKLKPAADTKTTEVTPSTPKETAAATSP